MENTELRLSIGAILTVVILQQFISSAYAAGPTPVSEIKTASATGTLQPDTDPTTGLNLTLSPVFINITTNPGLDLTSSFKVTNNNNVNEFLKLSLIKFKADSTGGNIVPVEIDASDEFVNWISFSEDQFEVAPNETKTIKFKISPPKTAALGYYYGIRVSRLKELSAKKGKAVIAGGAVLSLLMEVRSPNAKKQLSIVDFTTNAPFYEYLPISFNVKVKNLGNVHSVPFGDIFIDQGSKKDVGVIKVNDGRSNVLPGTERTLSMQWKEGFPLRVPKMNGESVVTDKSGRSVYTTQWDFGKVANFRIGKYTANLIMVYDDGKRDVPMNAQLSFWVIPWKILLGALLLIILVLFGLKSIVASIFKRR